MANYHLCMEPQPWPRTGSGEAIDGKPRFDLDRFDDSYFAGSENAWSQPVNEGSMSG